MRQVQLDWTNTNGFEIDEAWRAVRKQHIPAVRRTMNQPLQTGSHSGLQLGRQSVKRVQQEKPIAL
jgi:hypothetical protein